MLVTIDASGGSSAVTANAGLLSINTMRAIRAVATAGAGSVPVANVIVQSNTLYPVAIQVPGSNTVAVPIAVAGAAPAVGTANVFQYANGFGLVANSTVSIANTATLTSATITALSTANTVAGAINVQSANVTGGLVFSGGQTNTIANGMLMYVSGTPSGTGAITNFSNGYFLIQNVSGANFQLCYPNGTPTATTGGGNAIGGLTFQYGYMTVITGSSIYAGQGITSAAPATAIIYQNSGTAAGAGTYILSWPGPYTTATSAAATGWTTSQTQSSAAYYGTTMIGTGLATTGIQSITTTGAFQYPTAHNLVVGQVVVVTNTATIGAISTNASGTQYYVTSVANSTVFTLSSTVNGSGITTGAANTVAAAGTIFTPLPGPMSMIQYGTNNMITSIVANTEGGGWLLDANNTVNDFYSLVQGGVVTTTSTGGLILDLYNSTALVNKPSFPYHKISIIPQPTTNSTSSTANCVLAYHGASAYLGFANNLAGTTLAFSGNTTVASGLGSAVGTTVPTGPSAMVNQRTAYTGATPANWQLSDYVFTLACNSYYMHVISNNFIVSMGTRVTQAWEDNYPDNPPVYSLSVDTRTAATSVFYPSSIFAYMRSISNTATFNGPARYQTTQLGIVAVANTNPVTGQSMTTTATAPQTFDLSFVRQQAPMGGVFQLNSHYLSTSYPVGYGPVYDSTTGTLVPPAYPIVMQVSRAGNYNGGGNVRGLYKSLSNSNNASAAMTMSNFYVANASYTVDGDPYTPVLNGTAGQTDLFLVRRA